MFPWIMALASVLGSKKQAKDQKKQAASELMARNAQRLGGNTDVLDAASKRDAIDSQATMNIGAGLANSLVGRVGQSGQQGPPRAAGLDQGALRDPNAWGDPEGQRRLSALRSWR